MGAYTKGYYRERLAKRQLEADGYQVFRSAGSKGPWDLIAINVERVRLIQVKSRKVSREKILNRVPLYATMLDCVGELWIYKGDKKFEIERVL